MTSLKVLAAVLLVSLTASRAAQAMEIRQFDKMAVPDQGEYVGLLIAGAEKVLNEEGRPDLAEKVVQLFTTTEPGDAATLGNVEFQKNLARARLADAKNVAKDPNARRIEVEDAMAVTLKKNGIDPPQSFFTVGSSLRSKHPLQQ